MIERRCGYLLPRTVETYSRLKYGIVSPFGGLECSFLPGEHAIYRKWADAWDDDLRRDVETLTTRVEAFYLGFASELLIRSFPGLRDAVSIQEAQLTFLGLPKEPPNPNDYD